MIEQWEPKTKGGHLVLLCIAHEGSHHRWKGVVRDEHGTIMCGWTENGRCNADGTESEYDLLKAGPNREKASLEIVQAFSDASGAHARAEQALIAAQELRQRAHDKLRLVLGDIEGGAAVAVDPTGRYFLFWLEEEQVEIEEIQFSFSPF
jgi:hypothetical protein